MTSVTSGSSFSRSWARGGRLATPPRAIGDDGRPSMREQDRERRLRQQALGGAAKNELAPARVPIGAHHENVDLMRNGVGLEHLADPPSVGVDLVEHHVDAMARQVLGQRFGGMLAVQLL